jgi:hypothetical protein
MSSANIGRLKAAGLITQKRDGRVELRSFGRAALVTLLALAMRDAEEAEQAIMARKES